MQPPQVTFRQLFQAPGGVYRVAAQHRVAREWYDAERDAWLVNEVELELWARVSQPRPVGYVPAGVDIYVVRDDGLSVMTQWVPVRKDDINGSIDNQGS